MEVMAPNQPDSLEVPALCWRRENATRAGLIG